MFVRPSLRLVGTAEQKAAFKAGSRKGSDIGWGPDIMRITGAHGNHYKVDGLPGRLINPADLLKVPNATAQAYEKPAAQKRSLPQGVREKD
eukprot:22064-Eustigmatos_ZCMA.PRE.1